jgi:hypothetical protein
MLSPPGAFDILLPGLSELRNVAAIPTIASTRSQHQLQDLFASGNAQLDRFDKILGTLNRIVLLSKVLSSITCPAQ